MCYRLGWKAPTGAVWGFSGCPLPKPMHPTLGSFTLVGAKHLPSSHRALVPRVKREEEEATSNQSGHRDSLD